MDTDYCCETVFLEFYIICIGLFPILNRVGFSLQVYYSWKIPFIQLTPDTKINKKKTFFKAKK